MAKKQLRPEECCNATTQVLAFLGLLVLVTGLFYGLCSTVNYFSDLNNKIYALDKEVTDLEKCATIYIDDNTAFTNCINLKMILYSTYKDKN